MWRKARQFIASRSEPGDEQQPRRRRREDGDGGFRKLAATFLQQLQARTRAQFIEAGRNRLRRIRVIRLSREAWGPPDAHLQTTLDLLNGGAPQEASNNHAFRSYVQPGQNSISCNL